jgi:glycerol-3-phosphate dehydrogenase
MTDVIDGSVDYLLLNGTNAAADLSYGAFTSSTFQYNDNNAVTQIAYCFAEKQGYSKFGKYVGNGVIIQMVHLSIQASDLLLL